MRNGFGNIDEAGGHLRPKRLAAALSALIVMISGGSYPPFSLAQALVGGDFINERQKVRAPELEGHSGWLNTAKPLKLAGLKGKIVLLDFWTYGCVNCIHIIPDLKRLEATYQKELVVIGVHSAKFDNERETDNIRRIILRYGIEHPVVNDSRFAIWNAYAVNAWPTQVLIDPDGYVSARLSGEGNYDVFNRLIAQTAADFRKKGKLDESPIEFALERARVGSLPLAFPGKLLADASSDTLIISDSNHNRIVVSDLEGNVRAVIGSGIAGLRDGDYAAAAFDKPQGLALDGRHLYVADTGNHSIRRVDLRSKTVETVGGTGTLDGFNGFGGKALETSLRSPWDLEFAAGRLYIAMAGSHQIWRLDPERGYIGPYAGTRWESRKDGPVTDAHFAQPSGLAHADGKLFVADSESNIIREIDLEKGRVFTVAGGDLFKFGDEDGEGNGVRFQHPLGVEEYGGKVLIADTYNHKIKLLEPSTGKVKTLLGTGKEGQADGARAEFYEPGGLSVAGGKLYIADTNNHAVRIADLETGIVRTLELKGLEPPGDGVEERRSGLKEDLSELPPSEVSPGTAIEFRVDVSLPDGFHLNPSAPQKLDVSVTGEAKASEVEPLRRFPYAFEVSTVSPGSAVVTVEATIYYCREDNTGVCYIKRLRWKKPLSISPSGTSILKVDLEGAAEESMR